MAPESCLDENQLLVLLDSSAPAADRAAVEQHVAQCDQCADVIDILISVHGVAEPSEPEQAPFKLGRFVPLSEIGRGGMGRVLAAYDPKLDRRIALKLLSRVGGVARRGDADRLEREARAMAQVSHPNVVTIHDVGVIGNSVFLAMELVEGDTLRAWMSKKDRDWREVVAMFTSIGEGLAAAHQAGLVHRDFKPDNVLIDGNGRPLITDFGLASGVASRVGESVNRLLTQLSSEASPSDDAKLTLTGTAMGTPAYMAPEQFRGSSVDERSDQFSFCVSLHEALFGVRPFAGERFVDLWSAVTAGDRRTVSPGAVPAPVRAVVERGLALDPENRYPSMRQLLADLAWRPRSRRRAAWLAATLALAVGATAGATNWLSATSPKAKCELSPQAASLWTEAERNLARQRVVAALPGAPGDEVANRLERAVGDLQRRWGQTWGRVCERTHVTGEQSELLLDLRMACLARSRAQVDELIDRLVAGAVLDSSLAARAARAAGAVDDPQACASLEASVESALPVSPEQRVLVRSVRDEIAALRVLYELGDFAPMLAKAESALASAVELDRGELRAEAAYHRAMALAALSRSEQAEAAMREAAALAGAVPDASLAGRAWAQLVKIVGQDAHRVDEGLALAPVADVAASLAGDPGIRAMYLQNLGELYVSKGDFARAEPMVRDALALCRRPRDRMTALNLLGTIHLRQANYDEAEPLLRESLEISVELDGALANRVGLAAHNLAVLYRRTGDYARARERINQAIRVFEARSGGPLYIGGSLELAGNIERKDGELEQALALHTRALALVESHDEAQPVGRARALENVGVDLYLLGRVDEAIAHYERASGLLEPVVDAGFPGRIRLSANLGYAYATVGRVREGIALADDSHKRARKRWGEDHPQTLWALGMLAEVQVHYGTVRDGLSLSRRLVEAVSDGGDAPSARQRLSAAYSLLGEVELRANALDRARRAFDRAQAALGGDLDAGDEHSAVAFGRARIRWRGGERDKAVQQVRALLDSRTASGTVLERRMSAWLDKASL